MLFTSRMMRRAFAAVALTGIATLSACGDSSGPGGGNKYNLYSVDGETLPYTVEYAPGESETVRSGSLTLLAGNKFTFRLSMRDQFEGETFNYTAGTNGTYEIEGDTYIFTNTHYVFNTETEAADPGDVVYGTLEGNELTVESEGQTLVFRK